MAKKELTPEQLEARRAGCRKSYAKHKEERRISRKNIMLNINHKLRQKAINTMKSIKMI